jgi:hypothetical protein
VSKTRAEFESEYNNGDIAPLLQRGRLSIECYCDDDGCDGWKMSAIDRLPEDLYLYGNSSSEVAFALWHRLGLLNQLKLDGKTID